ncbi:protein Wnt-7b-like protein, partial [Leptotrombidium deliense]
TGLMFANTIKSRNSIEIKKLCRKKLTERRKDDDFKIPLIKEAAFVYAITSAGVVYSTTKSCQNASISCECDNSLNANKITSDDWEWGGCSVSVRHGMRIARKFFDSREIERDHRSWMNLHNNRVGRRVSFAFILLCAHKKCYMLTTKVVKEQDRASNIQLGNDCKRI